MINDHDPLVTIAIPTFNRAETFLAPALKSAVEQTYRNLDILVSDNASQDATEKVVKSFADERIRYHRHPENIGGPRNWNFCIDQARGDYVLLLMDDDLIDPDLIAVCVARAKQAPSAGVIRTGTRVIDEQGKVLRESVNRAGGLDFPEFVVAWTDGRTTYQLCSTLFKTEPLKKIGMHSGNYLCCDVITELKIIAEHGREDIPDIKAAFRLHRGEITSNVQIEKWCEDALELMDVIARLLPQRPDVVESRVRPFLAMLNYDHALRLDNKSWLARLDACRTVRNRMGVDPELRKLGLHQQLRRRCDAR